MLYHLCSLGDKTDGSFPLGPSGSRLRWRLQAEVPTQQHCEAISWIVKKQKGEWHAWSRVLRGKVVASEVGEWKQDQLLQSFVIKCKELAFYFKQ